MLYLRIFTLDTMLNGVEIHLKSTTEIS